MNIGSYHYSVIASWDLVAAISKIDYFNGCLSGTKKTEHLGIERLEAQAVLDSTMFSARIARVKLGDEQVKELIENRDRIPESRDAGEVRGYYDTLELINRSYEDININEEHIKMLHNICIKYVNKHQGQYKVSENSEETFLADGGRTMRFQTADPGQATEESMDELVNWYNSNYEVHSLVRSAVFVYVFARIHPFQDANWRMSRLLTQLLLLKNGYTWVKYISLDHEIGEKWGEYYRVFKQYPVHQQGEDISDWLNFFFDVLGIAQQKLLQEVALATENTQALSPRDKSILGIIAGSPGCKSGEIAEKTRIPAPTIKRLLSDLYARNLIQRYGSGPGTNYSIK